MTPPGYIALGYGDLAMVSSLLVLSGGLSFLAQLKITTNLVIAALRSAVQLTLVAMVLKILFALVSPLWTAIAAAIMILLAGREIAARQHHKFKGPWAYLVGTSSMMGAASAVTAIALLSAIRPQPWFDPRFALPLLGMILGNTLNAIAIALERLLSTAVRERDAIEARLALGHDRHSALSHMVRGAARAGMMPIINAMSAAGIISLPGMMTGQILAGIDPGEAVKYQILIMFLLAGSSTLGVLGALALAVRRLSDSRHRLRLDRVRGAS